MANTYNSFEQYISENAALRQTLADTLTEKGVEASGKEGYASLVPKAVEALGGGNDNGGLPDGYTKLGYIQSSGTQYIDTGFKPNQDTRIVLDMQFPQTPAADIENIFTASTSNTAQLWCWYWKSNNAFYFRYGSGTNYAVAGDPLARNIVDLNKETMTIGDTSVSAAAYTYSSTVSLALFAFNDSSGANGCSSYRLYSCQIYDNGTLVRDFVPARNSDGEIGLYDKANGVFYGNAGTGEFAGGGNKFDTPLPELTSPATASEILSGYEAYGADGSKIVGEMSAGLKVLSGSASMSNKQSRTVSQSGIKYAIMQYGNTTSTTAGGAVGNTYYVGNNGSLYGTITVSDTGVTIKSRTSGSNVTATYYYHIFYEE